MRKSVEHLAEQLRGIRPGSLSIGFVETFRVQVQGNSVKLGHLATISSQGDRILISPFDKSNLSSVVSSLTAAKLNAFALNPNTACVSVPPVSVEQRQEIIRHVKKLGEEAKIALRAIRQDARKRIAAQGRGSERAVQAGIDAAVEEVEQLVKAKIAEVEK
ncbi:ribosome-recycling factor [Singulisphaera sp. PoT]|uniref:ribosome-recycling factor n=1 Tax=Singulisphaera sp. PoT TaxID=3411797 RepID=UPI003BF48E5F